MKKEEFKSEEQKSATQNALLCTKQSYQFI